MCARLYERRSTADMGVGGGERMKLPRSCELMEREKDQIEFAHALNECKYSRDEFIV